MIREIHENLFYTSDRLLGASSGVTAQNHANHVISWLRHTILVGSLILLHGAITVVGGALHALPGCGHDVSAVHHPIGSDGGLGTHCPDLGPVGAAHCSLCHYLFQGQVLSEVVRVQSAYLALPHTIRHDLTSPTLQNHPTSHPRAPPADSVG
ncbi:MAG TPA: hypothetical protein VHS97_02915 [Isosphaeraceae bacterium]|nr:hypothetical protein [Isosphaeraceae bacterium]